jgi:hypothetical protein
VPKVIITYPLNIIYCGKCGLPPEYCEWSAKGIDIEDCKKWLKETHPLHHEKLYPTVPATED